jgi:D-serine deaminase-like pyridoxal phosphate-dependent protein
MPRRSRLADVPTPAAVLDLDVLERNVARMAAKARALGVALRPHAKTHKCLEVARLQRERGASGLTVATLAEARAFADAGFDDITWAVPVVPGRLDEVVALARRVTLRVVVESETAVDAVRRAAVEAGVAVHVWLEVDSGQHRTGVDPASPLAEALARRIAAAGPGAGGGTAGADAARGGLSFDGILTHAGQGYGAKDRAELARAAATERDVMVDLATRLRRAGVPVPGVSIGSTPTMAAVADLTGVTEIRPGNYAFNDFAQVAGGVCVSADCAYSVLATVISHQTGADHAVVDAGALSLSKDLGPPDPARRRGYGPLLRGLSGGEVDPVLQVRGVTQEHGVVGAADGAERGLPASGIAWSAVEGRLAVGEKVRILANHSCLSAALFDEYWVVRGEEVVDRWRIRRER